VGKNICKPVKIGLVLLWIGLKSSTTVLMQKLVKKNQKNQHSISSVNRSIQPIPVLQAN